MPELNIDKETTLPPMDTSMGCLDPQAPLADMGGTTPPGAGPQKPTSDIQAWDIYNDSGFEQSAEELTDTEGPLRKTEWAHTPPAITFDHTEATYAEASPVLLPHPEPVIIDQGHSPVPEPVIIDQGHSPVPEPVIVDQVHSPVPESVIIDQVHTPVPEPVIIGQVHTPVPQPPVEEAGGVEEVDELGYDADSAYDGDSLNNEDTATLESFITNYRWENGRRYHAYSDGAYWGPNDEDANDSQDLAHHLFKLTLDGKLHLAPIRNPHNILDVGTGTGIWAIEMADLYPSAHVIGTDLSPIQPTFVPPNCQFEIEDCNLDWTYPYSHFDFIHVRELFGSVPDWDRFFQQIMLAMKPGGYLEVCEHSVQPISDDETVGPDSFYTLWGNTVIEMGELRGKSFSIWKETKDRMQRAGFVDLVEERFKWPMNGWSKDPKLRELGRWNQLRLYDGIEGMMIRMLTGAGGWSYQRAQVFLAEMRKALKDYSTHAYLDVSIVYGRKPPCNEA